MKKVILAAIMFAGISAQAAVKVLPASSQKECSNWATSYSRQVSGDGEITHSATVKVVELVSGLLIERAFFNGANYDACKSKIEKGDYSCASVTVDFLYNQDTHQCIMAGYELGDGNG
ncbi:hypothetical protein [Bdellovibrio sp. KM01]|uniref:hypothetical protein n=1 Tax=Bdellovibrio sp. KM01 TaxID=2748865 RepID=UPI0015E9E07F|nr:hypothetical protein [Bdellovibrio sp. KM01]QLY23877.1 hypothetical protein HW988_10285 [Bdellovibrio sp. KM01]